MIVTWCEKSKMGLPWKVQVQVLKYSYNTWRNTSERKADGNLETNCEEGKGLIHIQRLTGYRYIAKTRKAWQVPPTGWSIITLFCYVSGFQNSKTWHWALLIEVSWKRGKDTIWPIVLYYQLMLTRTIKKPFKLLRSACSAIVLFGWQRWCSLTTWIQSSHLPAK